MYPATFYCRKECLPILDIDGLVKSCLFIPLSELEAASGIEKLCLVMKRSEESAFRAGTILLSISQNPLHVLVMLAVVMMVLVSRRMSN